MKKITLLFISVLHCAAITSVHAATPADGSYVTASSLVYPGTFNNDLRIDIVEGEVASASGTVFLLDCSQEGADEDAPLKPPRYFGVDLSKTDIMSGGEGLFIITTRINHDGAQQIPRIDRGQYLPMHATLNFHASTEAWFDYTMALSFFTGVELETASCLMNERLLIVRSPE
ncbi:MAG: hypothetical protein WD406_08150 [Pseudohongiellaceae bacterium]